MYLIYDIFSSVHINKDETTKEKYFLTGILMIKHLVIGRLVLFG